MRLTSIALALLFPAALAAQSQPTSPTPFSLYISSESGDIVTRVDVGPEGWRKVREIGVGVIPTGPDGPHNTAVSPDQRFWYVSIAHGTPFGSIWKFDADADTLLSRVRVGMFPTTIGLSPDGAWAFVPNSDFHGDRGQQNTISVVYTPDMTELTAVPTCDMPHGSRYNHAGTAVYIACMMSDELVVMDPSTFAIQRRIMLGSGNPMSMAEHMRMEARSDSLEAARLRAGVPAAPAARDEHAGHQMPAPAPAPAAAPAARPSLGAASSTMSGQNPDCLTTYVSVSPDDRLLYLACNHSNEVQVRDAATLALVRRLPTGNGAYNVEPSPDGRWLLVTNKKAQSVSVFDTRDWSERARIATTKRIPHGIAFSPDGRWAFVTQESVGSDPGAVDAIDLGSMQRVASMEIPLQPTGIAVRRHLR